MSTRSNFSGDHSPTYRLSPSERVERPSIPHGAEGSHKFGLAGKSSRNVDQKYALINQALLQGQAELTANNWTKNADSRDLNCQEVAPDDPSAIAFCARGYLVHKLNSWLEAADFHYLTELLHRASGFLHGQDKHDIFEFNDASATTIDNIIELYSIALTLMWNDQQNDMARLGLPNQAMEKEIETIVSIGWRQATGKTWS